MKFEFIISIGFFCSVASELEEKGYRDCSFPFDWVISDMDSINVLIRDKFDNLFSLEKLFRDEKYPDIVKHQDYHVHFYHDFSVDKSIEEQLPQVKEKYSRRIKRFFAILESGKPILFLRYILDREEFCDTSSDIDVFIAEIKKYTSNFKIILLKPPHSELGVIENHSHVLGVIEVERDENDSVCRNFFRNPNVYRQFRILVRYPIKKKVRNWIRNFKKKRNKQSPVQ